MYIYIYTMYVFIFKWVYIDTLNLAKHLNVDSVHMYVSTTYMYVSICCRYMNVDSVCIYNIYV